MRSYMAFWLSAALGTTGLAAVILVHGGWEAAAAAFAILAGLVFLGSVIALGSGRDRRGSWS